MKISNKFLSLFTILCLTLTQNALATRLGSGRSYGMQRQIPHSNYYNGPSHYTYNPGNPSNPVTPGSNVNYQQPRSHMGAGTAAALGAAAGAAGGYLVGRNMANGNNTYASGVQAQPQSYSQQSSQQSHIPWGIIAILAIILGFGLMLFRKSKPTPQYMNQSPTDNLTNFRQNIVSSPQQNQATQPQPGTNPQNSQPINNLERMPDGVETVYFLRQVKGMFLHIQSMNNIDNIEEIAKYMTAELYAQIKESIRTNPNIADFNNLECNLLDCKLEGNQLIASVKFSGLVSEEATSPSTPFSEIWNFIKPDLSTNKWLVAGIQQETLN